MNYTAHGEKCSLAVQCQFALLSETFSLVQVRLQSTLFEDSCLSLPKWFLYVFRCLGQSLLASVVNTFD